MDGPTGREFGQLEARVAALEHDLSQVNTKLDKLLEAAAMGKGAWWLILRLGGITVAVLTAIAWLVDTTIRILKGG